MATNDVLVRPGLPPAGADRPARGSPGPLVAAGAAVAAAAVLTQSLLYLVGHFVFGISLFADGTAAAFEAVAGTAAVGTCAIGAGIVAAAMPAKRAHAGVLAALLAYFAIDKAVGVHERIAMGIRDLLGLGNVGIAPVWLVLYAPALALGAVLIVRLQGSASSPGRRVARAGVVALGAALATQAVWVLVRHFTEPGGPSHVLQVVTEEGFELGGWLLVATGLAAILWSRGDERLRGAA